MDFTSGLAVNLQNIICKDSDVVLRPIVRYGSLTLGNNLGNSE
jgi:hypothetical protein